MYYDLDLSRKCCLVPELIRLSSELTLCFEKSMLTPEYFRRERNDGDQVPLFASSEEKTPWMDHRSVDRAASFSSRSSAEGDAVHATTLDAATDLLEGFIDDLSATEASDLMRGEEPVDEDGENGEGYVFNDLGEAASFNMARPPNPDDVCEVKKQNSFCQTAFGLQNIFQKRMGFNTALRSYMTWNVFL